MSDHTIARPGSLTLPPERPWSTGSRRRRRVCRTPVVDDIVRQFGGMTAVDVGHLEVQRGIIIGADRPQRCRQDDVLQPDHRVRPSHHGRQGAHWAFDGAPWTRPRPPASRAGMVRHLPAHQGAEPDDRDREHDARRAGTGPGEPLQVDVPPHLAGPGARERGEGRRPLARFKLYEKKHDYAGSLRRPAAAGDGRALMSDPKDDHARRADGWGEPGAPVAARGTSRRFARRGHDRPLRGARHARRAPSPTGSP